MPSRSLVPEQSSRKRGRASDRSTSTSAPEKADISGINTKSDLVKSTAGHSGVAGNSKGSAGISFLSTPIKPKAATSPVSSSSNHKSRSSFSSTFFSSSPSLLWRRGPELESSVPIMSSSVKQRGKSGAGKGRDGQGSGGGDISASSSSAGGGAKRVSHSPQFWQKNYLVAYNLVSGVLWAMILVRVLLLYPVVGAEHVYDGMGEFVKWVQTGAVLEIVHSLIGLVRAPLFTTLMQVSSRLLLVWPVVWRHAAATAPSRFYSSMLVAWSVTEVIRYGYFVMQLKGGGRPGAVPRALVWLRYNTFFVLYPLGITSEVVMVWRASVAGRDETSDAEAYALWAVLAVYVPGSYVLYTHMMRQRRKVMGAASRPRVDSIKSAVYTK